MAKRSQAITADRPLADQIDVARADLKAACDQAALVAAEETDNLENDEVYSSWQRRRRIADVEVNRLSRLVDTLEADRVAQRNQAEFNRYTARWKAAANRNREVAEMMQTQLPKAWEIIEGVLEAAALAEIETDAVLREQPAHFAAPCSIGNPEAFRSRPSFDEQILEERTVDLFVDKKTGALFADQTRQRPGSVVRQFRQVTYLPMQLGNTAIPFFKDLRFPRLNDSGGPLFDGSEVDSPLDALRILRKPRPERHQRQQQVRIEPMVAQKQNSDTGPAVVT